MAGQLSREDAIAEFQRLVDELHAVKDSDHFRYEGFVEARRRVTAIADRGALLLPSIPLAVDLPSVWHFVDRGMLPQDGGAPIHAFHRRLFHYLGAAERIRDILRDDVIWKLHGRVQDLRAGEAEAPVGAPIAGQDQVRPTLFIGSTVEALDIARAIHAELDYDMEVTVWNHGLFAPGSSTWSELVKNASKFDFALLVFSGDDQVESRGVESLGVRDNVLIEFGLFVGSIGPDRTFFLYERKHLPRIASDLAGVTPLTFQARQDQNLLAAVSPACDEIRRSAKKLGSRRR